MYNIPPVEPERRITDETFDFSNGPIDLFLKDDHLRIVDPERDLNTFARQGLNVRIGCFVIDPVHLDAPNQKGFKAVRDGESVVFGRYNTHDRFTFGYTTSRSHVMISRTGTEIRVRDLGSLNGTFIGRSAVMSSVEITTPSTLKLESHSKFESRSFKIGAASLPSEKHPETNEDSWFTNVQNPAIGVFDGVGGNYGSGAASRIGARITNEMLNNSRSMLPVSLSLLEVKQALEKAHAAILREANGSGIATTATVAKLFKEMDGTPYAAIASVGDSRAYLLRDGALTFLTLDKAYEIASAPKHLKDQQETLARVVNLAELTEEEVLAFRTRNYIDSALGTDSTPTITATHIRLKPGDRLLLTTDGVHDNLTTDEIKSQLLLEKDDDQAATSLVRASQARAYAQHVRSKHDDMTATLLTYTG